MQSSSATNELAHVTLLNVEKVAALLGVHRRTVWRLVSAGALPQPIHVSPKIVRWRLSDLEEYLCRTDD